VEPAQEKEFGLKIAVIGIEFPKPVGVHTISPYAPEATDGTTGFNVLPCWISVLFWIHYSFLCPHSSLFEWECLL
jgi:hypothetical protein